MSEKVGERRGDGGGGKESTTQKFKNHPEHNDKITTFFITNFPENIKAADLLGTFARFWKVGEVFIPARRDRFGKRFGFARFAEVKDAQELLKKIEGVWFGTYKIRANISRFKRGEDGAGTVAQRANVESLRERGVEDRTTRKGMSFKHVLTGLNEDDHRRKSNELKGVLKVETVRSNLEVLNQSYVGILWKEDEADQIQMKILMEGFQDVQARFLGVDLILLSSPKPEGVMRAVKSNQKWWERWFSEIKPWNPSLKPRGRRIWVRIFGAPIHAWGWECFERIICRLGRLIKLDEQTETQGRLDVARALIAVSSWGFVDSIQEIKVNEELFITRVVEERFGEIDLGITRESFSKVEDEDSTGDTASVGRPDEDQQGWEDGGSVGESGDEGGGVCRQNPVGINQSAVNIVTEVREMVPPVLSKTDNREQRGDGDMRVLELVEGGKVEGFQTKILTKGVELVDGSLEEEREVMVCEEVRPCQEGSGIVLLVDNGKTGLHGETGTTPVDSQNKEVGPTESDPIFVQREGKDVAIVEKVDFNKISLLKGSGSKWAVGPNILELEAEDLFIKRLNSQEVAQIDWELKNSLFPSVPRNQLTEPITNEVEDRRRGGETQKRLNIDQGLLSKSCRFAQAVRSSVGGRKGATKKKKKKGKPAVVNKTVTYGDSISSTSILHSDTDSTADKNPTEVAEIGNNLVYDKKSEVYRKEADRLFNIGINLGCTSNEERITMIERLIDLESKGNGQEEGLGDEEVDQ
jgi:hypothetical protein